MMRPMPTYKYLSVGHMIQIDFPSWQRDHLHVICYLTAYSCLMVQAVVELKCFVQILVIETNFVIYNNKFGWQAAIDAIMTKWLDPTIEPHTATAAGTPGVLTVASSSATEEPEIIENSHSLNGSWIKFHDDPNGTTK